jgi:D-alanyl-D-alanine carboxypeptidase
MSRNLHFRIGSVTKTYTSTVVLQLYDEGLINLDDPIGKYLPGLVPQEDKITIRHLLEMRSGLGDYNNSELAKFFEANPGRILTPEELMQFASFMIGEPGGEFNYTNTNYILLGILIEKVTNRTFEEQVKRRILQPLGMSQTFAPTDPEIPAPYAHGYRYEGGKLTDATFSLPPFLF